MVFEGCRLTWHIIVGVLLSPMLFCLAGYFELQDWSPRLWLTGMPLLYAGSLLIGRYHSLNTYLRVEID